LKMYLLPLHFFQAHKKTAQLKVEWKIGLVRRLGSE
jgi:hypothetical protein